jgi:Ca2+/H+ antiporter
MSVTFLALKLTLAPALVALATVVARRLGHRAGGLIGGLPVVAAPIVLIYALQHGAGYAARAAQGTVLGIVSLVGFSVVYAAARDGCRGPPR